jgi:hypothetical protein
MKRQCALSAGDRGHDELLAAQLVVRRPGEYQHRPPTPLLMARHRIKVGEGEERAQ